ncbi:MAG: type II toxin-antitoxin system VapC family toxin [Methanosarcinales archaeon]|nr:type II toxin-antitoxin system VapC family toxin [Methanosarcinales archaeon]
MSKENQERIVIKISLDTNIFLNVKNNEEPFFEYSVKILDSIDGNIIECNLSTIVLSEICTEYYENNEIKEKNIFMTHIRTSLTYHIISVDERIADLAGKMRVENSIRLPDALIAVRRFLIIVSI